MHVQWFKSGDSRYHDDVIKWKHFPRFWPFVLEIHRSPVNSPHKGQWRGALMFPFICVWINGWVNNRKAGDLRRYRAHYDVTVMIQYLSEDLYTPKSKYWYMILSKTFSTNLQSMLNTFVNTYFSLDETVECQLSFSEDIDKGVHLTLVFWCMDIAESRDNTVSFLWNQYTTSGGIKPISPVPLFSRSFTTNKTLPRYM